MSRRMRGGKKILSVISVNLMRRILVIGSEIQDGHWGTRGFVASPITVYTFSIMHVVGQVSSAPRSAVS